MKPHRLPFVFIIAVLLLIVFGLATFYVASLAERYTLGHFGSYYAYFKKTLMFLAFSLVAAALLQFVNYRVYRYFVVPAYVVQAVLLVLVLLFGQGLYGSRRWIPIGPFGLQPSEYAKLIVIAAVAFILTIRAQKLGLGSRVLLSALAAVPPVLLVMRQPDLGTASILLGASVMIIAHFRLTRKQLTALGLILVIAAVGIWFSLSPEQHSRIETFLDPQSDPLGDGYNVIQSIVATGSGGLWGRGIRGSTQAPLSFVPVQYADFVFSLVGELFGFVGSTILVLLFVLLLWSTYLVFRSLTDDFARLIVVGIASMWFLQAAVNMGMAVGLSPVTGIPLPFISYGGQSLLVHIVAASIVVNVYRTRDELRF